MDAITRIDPLEFRNALGTFATGVCVITSRCEEAGRIGVTANSFNSVSLNPPMVLWSLAKSSRAIKFFQQAGRFCVNILAADQVSLSNRFASKQRDKFADVSFQDGVLGMPVLDGCAATFECSTAFTHEGGDHLIFVGEVIDFKRTDKNTLLYHTGQYAISNPHPITAQTAKSKVSTPTGFVDDYLDYLLAKSTHQFESEFQTHLDRAGVKKFEWRVLVTVSDYDGINLEQLMDIVLLDKKHIFPLLEGLTARELLTQSPDDDCYYLTAQAEDIVVHLLAAAKGHEADTLGNFTLEEARTLKSLLKRLIRE